MSQYTQLTQEQRYQIYSFMKADFSQTQIADEINVRKSTVCREIRRNRGNKGYRPKQAHQKSIDRRKNAYKFRKMTPEVIAIIEDSIQQEFSPEQVSASLKFHYNIKVSHETIYQHVL